MVKPFLDEMIGDMSRGTTSSAAQCYSSKPNDKNIFNYFDSAISNFKF